MMLIRFPASLLAFVALLALASAGQAAEPTKIPIQFTTPGKGQFSLGVYDDSGTLIRSLSYAGEVDGGKQTLEWDGTTDLGLPARPGAYSARGVWFAEPLKASFKMKVGMSGDPPYVLDNGLGGWGGNLGSPMDVCSDGKRRRRRVRLRGIAQRDGRAVDGRNRPDRPPLLHLLPVGCAVRVRDGRHEHVPRARQHRGKEAGGGEV